MNRWITLFCCFFLVAASGCAQHSPAATTCLNEDFDKKIHRLLSFSVPTISPSALKAIHNDVLLLDAREEEEYRVSHIPNALHLGYKQINKDLLQTLPKDTTIVVYCSIGYRSEKAGEQLEEMGFTHVYNLYGSIFEWVNQGHPVVDKDNQPTPKVHTYNKNWSKWLENDEAVKVW